MTVTTGYSLANIGTATTVPTYNGESASISGVTALSDGGYAVVAQDADGYADLAVYNAAGIVVGSNYNFAVTGARIAQLSNGNIVVVGIDAGGTARYEIFGLDGKLVEAGPAGGRGTGMTQVSNVVADSSGGFTFAYQVDTGDDVKNIVLAQHLGDGTIAAHVVISDGYNNGDPSIALLANGNYAIAWDVTADNGNTSLSYEVYSPTSGVVKAALGYDNTGTVNSQPCVTALANGGFEISYQDNSYTNGLSDITGSVFAADGTALATAQLDNLTGNDVMPATAALSSGLVVTAFTNFSNNTANTDIRLGLYDTAGNLLVDAGGILAGESADEIDVSLTGLANGNFLASYATGNAGDQDVKVGIWQFTRHTTGDNLGDTIVGDDLPDEITGGTGNDNITGGNGANNIIYAGLGYDTANFSGSKADYTITRTGMVTFVNRPDGSGDGLLSVEKLHFADGDIYTPAQVRDLNGDGLSDVLFQSTTGAIRFWQTSTSGAIAVNALTSTTLSSAWRAVGTGNFSFAGDVKADILLQNTNGTMNIWEMNGATVTANVGLGSLNPVWSAVTTGDFNGDGNADILLQNTSTGQLDIWTMNGTTAASKTTVGSAIGAAWHAIATADFNGDGKSDIVLQNDSGQVAIWLMNGANVASSGSLNGTAGAGWTVRGAGDFNGDGKADLVLENAAGSLSIWTMNGTGVTAKTGIGSVASAFTVAGTGDYNGDGKSDIAFQNSNGAVAEWLMNGTTVTTKLNMGNPGTTWHMVAATGG